MRCLNRRHILLGICALAAALFFGFVSDLNAQNIRQFAHRQLTRSKIWHTFRNGLSGRVIRQPGSPWHAGMNYPGGFMDRDASDFNNWWGQWTVSATRGRFNLPYSTTRGEGIFILVPDKGVSAAGPRWNTDDIVGKVYDVASGPESHLGFETYAHYEGGYNYAEERRPGPMANYYPGAPAVARGPVEIHNHNYGHYIGDDAFPEEMVISQWTTKFGITVTRKAYAWSYPDFDDFIILELIFDNNGDTNGDGVPDAGLPESLKDVYFAFQNIETISSAGIFNTCCSWWSHNASHEDDYYRFTGAANYDGPVEYADLKISYHWDGDSPNTLWDDTGGPYVSSRHPPGFAHRPDNELTDAMYLGFAPIDTEPPFVNDPEVYEAPKVADQPVAANWFQIFSNSSYTEADPQKDSDEAIFQKLIEAGIQDNPTDIGSYVHSQSYGPYDLPPNGKAKLVMVFAGGYGGEFEDEDAGVDSRGLGFYEWAQLGRQEEIPNGLPVMVRHVRRAHLAYNSGYDLPDCPPDVATQHEDNPNGQWRLVWPDDADRAEDPDYSDPNEARDVVAYRVYRSTFKIEGPWKLLKEIPVGDPAHYDAAAGTYTFDDETSVAGFNYSYSVRTVDSGHSTWVNNDGTMTLEDLPLQLQNRVKNGMESGHSAPEQRMNRLVAPKVPGTADKDRLEEPVRVVPNPYRDDDLHKYPGSDRIRFVNIPRKCRISIFSPAGDLIRVIDHNAEVGETAWERQIPRSFIQETASGIYYYVVESLVPESEGKQFIGTFVIIR